VWLCCFVVRQLRVSLEQNNGIDATINLACSVGASFVQVREGFAEREECVVAARE
jgi:hypothetical protein